MTHQFVDMCAINLAMSVVIGDRFTDNYLDEAFYLSKIHQAMANIPGGFDRQVLLTQPQSATGEFVVDSNGIFQAVQPATLLVTYRDIVTEVAKMYLIDICNDWLGDNEITDIARFQSQDGKPTVEFLKQWVSTFKQNKVCGSSGIIEVNDIMVENLLYDFIFFLYK